jgi:hypothetical protein
VVLLCEDELNWSEKEEVSEDGEDCIDPETLDRKYGEISFVRSSEFSNDSATGKFILELHEAKNDSIHRKVLSEQQLSHLMMHKIQFLVNGVWLEHDVDESLFPIVSIRNSTGNELEVLYLDCSLADINLQFLDLFDFTSSFVFWFYVVEGICFVIFLAILLVKKIGCPPDIEDVIAIMILFSLVFSLVGFDFIFYILPTFSAIHLNFFTNIILISIVFCM